MACNRESCRENEERDGLRRSVEEAFARYANTQIRGEDGGGGGGGRRSGGCRPWRKEQTSPAVR